MEWRTSPDVWRGGVNRVTLRFAYEARPSDVGLGGDARQLAGAVDAIQISVR